MITAPAELLRDVHIVDTPGTNAIIREHEQLTADFVPRADLVLFVTSADRPFTETERAFLETIRGWGKKIVDRHQQGRHLRAQPRTSRRSSGFVRNVGAAAVWHHARNLSGERAPRASREAGRAVVCGGAAVSSRLRQFITATIWTKRSRFRLKLANPLGVGQALAAPLRHDRRRTPRAAERRHGGARRYRPAARGRTPAT